MFDTVLVANRGEIAVRIIATLRRLGVRSVAIYSDEDEDARHVREADEAWRVGATPARESYLHVQRVLDVAARARAQAVHPGYGFLAENAAFVRACDESGLVFIGPSADAVEMMGDKIRAKAAVAAAGVAVVPGCANAGMSDQDLLAAAGDVGFPLLVKPSAGGGGKGMRLVSSSQDLPAAILSARRESAASFGDDTLFLERFVEVPRHLEVQILFDAVGHGVHLGERECSLQRRHQKVIEEAPSPLLGDATRADVAAAALRVGEVTRYRGVGTVEFIVSARRPDEFFFMEMNTRLQVEHPVTEMVTGIDLVEQQLRVAAGEELSFSQDDVRLVGHAMEARIYAEDPSRDFLPTGGDLIFLREPRGEGVRVDGSLLAGTRVGTTYDPMLAKVIAHGADRGEARDRLDRALGDLITLGVVTNTAFLRRLLADDDVRRGALDTELVARVLHDAGPDGAIDEDSDDEDLVARAAVFAVAHLAWLTEAASREGEVASRFAVLDGWRVGRPASSSFVVATPDAGTIRIEVSGTWRDAWVQIEGRSPAAGVRCRERRDVSPGVLEVLVDVGGRTSRALVAREGPHTWIHRGGATTRWREVARARVGASSDAHDGEVRSPMPGVVIEVHARAGDRVASGDALVVVEAMKMEYTVKAPVAGRVSEVVVARGDQVEREQVLVRVSRESSVVDPGAPRVTT